VWDFLYLGRAVDIEDIKLGLCPEDSNTFPRTARIVNGCLDIILTAVISKTKEGDLATIGNRVDDGGP
jgi:hypothetical protein